MESFVRLKTRSLSFCHGLFCCSQSFILLKRHLKKTKTSSKKKTLRQMGPFSAVFWLYLPLVGLPPPHLCKPRDLCPTWSCMDPQVKHISATLLLMGSSAEQLALVPGRPAVIVSGLELLLMATASQREKAGRLSHIPGPSLSPILGLCPDLTTRVLPRQGTGNIEGIRESQQ